MVVHELWELAEIVNRAEAAIRRAGWALYCHDYDLPMYPTHGAWEYSEDEMDVLAAAKRREGEVEKLIECGSLVSVRWGQCATLPDGRKIYGGIAPAGAIN